MSEQSPSATAALRPYRLGVGIALFNRQGMLLLAERRDTPGAWQMPQGGLSKTDLDEPPHAAAAREMLEELGTNHATLLGWTGPTPLAYQFPDVLAAAAGGPAPFNGKYCGQRQWWFAYAFEGQDSDIQLINPHHDEEQPEFVNFGWFPPATALHRIVDFKRPVYAQVLAVFLPLSAALAAGQTLPAFTPPPLPADWRESARAP